MSISFTVCIPAYNEAVNLESLFQSLKESDLDLFDYEILLCDSGSDDGTQDLFEHWSKELNLYLIITPYCAIGPSVKSCRAHRSLCLIF